MHRQKMIAMGREPIPRLNRITGENGLMPCSHPEHHGPRMLPLGNFRRKKGQRRSSWCKVCTKPYHSAHVARRRKAGVTRVTPRQIRELWSRQGGLCACGCRASLLASGYHADHRIPVSKGGLHTIENLQLLTPHCNRSKSDKLPAPAPLG